MTDTATDRGWCSQCGCSISDCACCRWVTVPIADLRSHLMTRAEYERRDYPVQDGAGARLRAAANMPPKSLGGNAEDGTYKPDEGYNPPVSEYQEQRETAIARVHTWRTIVDAYRSTAGAIRSRAEHESPDAARALVKMARDLESTARTVVQMGPDAVHPLTVDPTLDGER